MKIRFFSKIARKLPGSFEDAQSVSRSVLECTGIDFRLPKVDMNFPKFSTFLTCLMTFLGCSAVAGCLLRVVAPSKYA